MPPAESDSVNPNRVFASPVDVRKRLVAGLSGCSEFGLHRSSSRIDGELFGFLTIFLYRSFSVFTFI